MVSQETIAEEDKKMATSNCTRCGKPRIVVSTYEEKIETSLVTYTITECSDPECQKLVEKDLRSDEKKRKFIKKEQERREDARKQLIEEKKREKLNA